jgi:hypothetical protein
VKKPVGLGEQVSVQRTRNFNQATGTMDVTTTTTAVKNENVGKFYFEAASYYENAQKTNVQNAANVMNL